METRSPKLVLRNLDSDVKVMLYSNIMPPSYEQLRSYWNEPACEDFMKALANCNEEYGFRRFLGECDKHSSDLNKCIIVEKESRRLAARRKTAAELRNN